MRNFSADKVPLEIQGLLVRVSGLVLEATGIRVPVGSVCEVLLEGRAAVVAEVVGFLWRPRLSHAHQRCGRSGERCPRGAALITSRAHGVWNIQAPVAPQW